MVLYRQYMRAQRNGMLIWVGAHVLLVLALAATAPAVQSNDLMSRFVSKLPPALQALTGLIPGLTAIDGFIAAKLGVWMAVVMPIYGCLLAVAAVTREVDNGSMDFLLALPVERGRLLISRWLGMATNLALLAGAVWLTLVVSFKAQGLTGSFGGYFWLMAQTWFLGLALGSLAMLASIWLDDYGNAVKYTLGAVGGLYAIDLGLKIANVAKLWRGFNPFAYLDPALPIMQNHLIWGDALVLTATALISLWLAMRAFRAKEIQA